MSDMHQQQQPGTLDPLIFVVIFLGCFAAFVSAQSLWLDELYSWYFADVRLDYVTLLSERMATDVHPPLYYSAVYFWSLLLGHSKEALRLLSLLPFLLTVVLLLGRNSESLDRSDRRLVAALLATSFLVSKFSMEARSYEWILLFSMMATLSLLDMLALWREKKAAGTGRLALGFSASILLCTIHFVGFIFGGLLILYGLVFALRAGDRRAALALFVTGTVCLLLMAIWLWISAEAVGRNVGGGHWISLEMAPSEIVSYFSKLFSANPILVALLAGCALSRPLAVLGDPVIRHSLAITLLFLVLALIVSLHSPMIIDRFLMVVAPAILFACARTLRLGVAGLSAGAMVFARNAALVTSCTLMIWLDARQLKSDWEGTASLVATFDACKGAPILTYPSLDDGSWLHSYYFDADPPQFLEFTMDGLATAQASACPILSWSTHIPQSRLQGFAEEQAIDDLATSCFSSFRAHLCFKQPLLD